ncbi:membrane protein [Streptomyces spiroverticillatus]|uniref:Membrane protein n=1 Tax=Streptomyces finlayi TaxID=67296 RepID=A0A918WSQ5_9ACTN|nr:PH domain-containing protein [Streptomyces finlayi]GGZ87366.1 membrane protein [Streptomyces spiroverticillatus]GHC78612.1 membrane protein [Streptomyces finlayi]
MTSTGPTSSSASPGPSGEPTAYADRVFRSGAGVFWGCAMLAVVAWLTIDALIKGEAATIWKVLAGLLFVVPLVVAFTIRPAVYAGADRLRIRNPFRTITLPWAAVDAVRSGYSSEVLAGGAKYQMWAVPVSIRQRKKAIRNQARSAASNDPDSTRTSFGRSSASNKPTVSMSDQTVRDLQELAESRASEPSAQGTPSVRWALEIIVPGAVGLVALIVLLATV